MSEYEVAWPGHLGTQRALYAVAWERAPRHPKGHLVNRRIVCGDGLRVSVQASVRHYAEDASGQAPYWALHPTVVYPFTSFEVGNPTDAQAVAEVLGESNGGVWPWVQPTTIVHLLDLHGGAVTWEGVNDTEEQA